ncbi:hypothetical protein ACOSQ3_024254 [Xanthoceras sorbifolium]
MSFAPFTGVNHHLQSIQFGSIGGHHSVSIITDQDLAMRGAIAKVFPNTHHRLCLWHIKKKFVEKLSHVYFKKSKFKVGMKKCIMSTYKIKEFGEQWKTLMMKNGLEKNEWLNHLYKIRVSWVLIYNLRVLNFFFDGFVTSMKNLKEFIIKSELAMKKIMERENNDRVVNDGELLLKYDLVKNYGKEKSEALRLSRMYIYEHQIDVFPKKDDLGTQIHSSPSLLLDPNISQTKSKKKENKNSGRLTSETQALDQDKEIIWFDLLLVT